MRIDGLVTCVGDKYKDYLKRSINIWADTCDTVTIATDFEPVFEVPSNVRFHQTDVFTAYGASFNKGAALSSAFAAANPNEWILNFDADVLPPKDWRKYVEEKLTVGRLFGCSHRYREDGTVIPDADFPNIWGFFHLWHVEDPHSWKRPPFEVDVGHAGNYDHTFMRQWPEKDRTDLWPELRVVHQGEPRQQWFGGDPKNGKKMASLFMLGLWEAWATKAGHVKVPEPEKRGMFFADDMTLELTMQRLAEYTAIDPFKYKLEIFPSRGLSKDEIKIGL